MAGLIAQNIIEIGKLVLLAEARLGELFNQMPKAKENQYTKSAISSCEEKANSEVEKPKPKMEVAAEMGFNKNQVAQFQKLADNPDAVQKAIDDAETNDEIVTAITDAVQSATQQGRIYNYGA